MARQLRTDAQIDAFIDRVIDEARHHASRVERIIKPLSDAVRAQMTKNRDKVAVYERNGNLARTCWVTISGRRYVFSYAYKNKTIELRDRSTRGQVLCSFDNNTSKKTIKLVVDQL